MYNGVDAPLALQVKTWMPLKIVDSQNREHDVSDKQIQEVHRGETTHNPDALIYLILSREKICKTKAWEKIYSMYPPDRETINSGFLSKVHKCCQGILSFMKNHVGLTLLFTALAVIIAKVVSYCVVTKEKIDIPRSDWLDSPTPMYCETCPGSPDCNCAKTKGVRKKYSNYVNVNQKKVKGSDLEDSAM